MIEVCRVWLVVSKWDNDTGWQSVVGGSKGEMIQVGRVWLVVVKGKMVQVGRVWLVVVKGK